MLGGFVIRHFMGPWTLVIKSLGLVSALNRPLCASAHLRKVLIRGIGSMAWQRGTISPCCLLLRQLNDEAVRELES